MVYSILCILCCVLYFVYFDSVVYCILYSIIIFYTMYCILRFFCILCTAYFGSIIYFIVKFRFLMYTSNLLHTLHCILYTIGGVVTNATPARRRAFTRAFLRSIYQKEVNDETASTILNSTS
jgi:hypothetical protein